MVVSHMPGNSFYRKSRLVSTRTQGDTQPIRQPETSIYRNKQTPKPQTSSTGESKWRSFVRFKIQNKTVRCESSDCSTLAIGVWQEDAYLCEKHAAEAISSFLAWTQRG